MADNSSFFSKVAESFAMKSIAEQLAKSVPALVVMIIVLSMVFYFASLQLNRMFDHLEITTQKASQLEGHFRDFRGTHHKIDMACEKIMKLEKVLDTQDKQLEEMKKLNEHLRQLQIRFSVIPKR